MFVYGVTQRNPCWYYVLVVSHLTAHLKQIGTFNTQILSLLLGNLLLLGSAGLDCIFLGKYLEISRSPLKEGIST